jgi:hypothetical protein
VDPELAGGAKVKAHHGGTVTLEVKVPGKGKLSVVEGASGATIAKLSTDVGGAGTVKFTIKPDAHGAAFLKNHKKVTVKLAVSFKPKGGISKTITVRGINLG